MKIKDIIESIESIKNKMLVAYRIFCCDKDIKNAIKYWKSENELPSLSVDIENEDEQFITISVNDLVHLYGFEELSAFLTLDDIRRASRSKNYERLDQLLAFLTYGKHEVRTKVSEELLEHIQNNTPEVWEEYQKICKKVEGDKKMQEQEFTKIIDSEL
jgi:hypothetical protein